MIGVPMMRNRDGFTLQETLVVLIVGALLIGFCFSMFFFGSRLVSTWQKQSDARLSAGLIAQYIAFDIQRSKEILDRTDSSFVLVKGIEKRITYTYHAKYLRRNEVEIHFPEGAELILEVRPVVTRPPATPGVRFVEIKAVLKTRLGEYRSSVRTRLDQAATQRFHAFSL